ncbi:hypothetical protein Moror_12093 [Moniliophthora roreri MCA 2997]|uniref:Uncharacterized protein n=2 Tax=Moniliophthora roreri TaxID=221103 RepID=V2WPQ9_MONRO|nr:hypothetical protein Moror_12093 [Moniliophthora roreri MCA 2997]
MSTSDPLCPTQSHAPLEKEFSSNSASGMGLHLQTVKNLQGPLEIESHRVQNLQAENQTLKQGKQQACEDRLCLSKENAHLLAEFEKKTQHCEDNTRFIYRLIEEKNRICEDRDREDAHFQDNMAVLIHEKEELGEKLEGLQASFLATLEFQLGRSKIGAHCWNWDDEFEDWTPVVILRGHPLPPIIFVDVDPRLLVDSEVTRKDIWSEYTVGFGNQISGRELNRYWGSRWYQWKGEGTVLSAWYVDFALEASRRRKLAHLIEELCAQKGSRWTPSKVLSYLDEEFPLSGTTKGLALRDFLNNLMTKGGFLNVKRKAKEYLHRKRAPL